MTKQAFFVSSRSEHSDVKCLHIHAEYGGSPDHFGDGVGIPMLFKEKGFLKRNDLLVVYDKL